MKKRIVSLMMAMLMVFSLMPTSVLAADATEVVACAVEGCIVTGEHTEHMFNVVPEGDDASATEGDDASAIEGDDASATEGDDASATEGDDASATEGDDASATEGDDASATEGDDASATEGDDASATEGDDASATEGDDASAIEGDDASETEGDDASATEGDDASATEGDDASASEGDEAATPAVCVENCLLAEGHEGDCYVCEEGCILEGSAEHEENGWECFVWIPCSLTEGCELADGHEGECTGSATFDGASITISTQTVKGKYIVIYDETAKTNTVYYVSSAGVVQTLDGQTAVFADGTYKIYYGSSGTAPNQNKTVYYAEVTITNGGSASVGMGSVNYKSYDTDGDTHTYTDDQYRYAMSIYYNTTNFNHVHVRVEGSYVIKIGGQEYEATVSNPSMVVNVNGVEKANHTWSTAASYEWTASVNVARSAQVEVILTFDLTYTDENGDTVVLEDVSVSYDNVNDLHKYYEAIAICDGVEGLDFTVSVEEIVKEIEYYTVTYVWKVYNSDGSYTELPTGAPSEPGPDTGIASGTEYVYDTSYATGASFTDYDTGLLYTFHGWDTWSHSSTFNVDPTATGYTALDDGDTDASNNATVPITKDTYIYGYWTVEQLDPASAYIAIEKVFAGDENAIAQAKDLYFVIDPGIDLDGDEISRVDVDYPMIEAAGGTYKLAVYQYDTPFVFTEYQADVPGYTRETTISVTGTNASGDATSGDTVNVTLKEVYQGKDVHLGTVIYTNTYTKNVGEAVSVYPSLYLLKSASDNGLQPGVTFTLYSDAACSTVVGTYTTDENGQLTIDFNKDTPAGTYYLKETNPAAGYIADTSVYPITLTAGTPVEELRNGEFVEVTYYTLTITKPDGSTATTNGIDYLHIYNDPILGKLNLSKATTGLADADKENLSATVIVHGPITRDDTNAITDIGGTWTLTLNKDNNWTTTLENLRVGEYLVHESFASVHGYTWTGVTYVNLSTVVYNNITSGVFKVTDSTPIDLVLTNTYEEWTEADFYIHKVNESGSKLAGAEFTLYSDAELKNVVTTKTTAADGYAHFVGFDAEGTYYLKETKAPAGYYLDDTVYKVEIKAVTDSQTNKTTYEPKISVKNESGDWVEASAFDNTTDLLEIVNYPVLGSLTIKKDIFVTSTDGETIPTGLTEIKVNVSGPGYNAVVELNASNEWRATINNLHLGTYTIVEQDANVPGYTLSTTYEDATVTLSEADPGKTVSGTAISGASTITNTYTRNEETYEKPTSLTIKKVDGENKALAGAVFSLTRKSDGTTVTYTTNANGVAVFDFLSGSIVDGSPVNGEYTLKEVTAPVGYAVPETEWTVRVAEDDGKLSVYVLNTDNNTYENFWQWIVESVTGNSQFEKNGSVLTVTNHKVTGKLEISKAQEGATDGFVTEVVVNVAGPNGYTNSVKLNASNNWTVTLTGLELGEYSVTEAEVTMKEGFSYSVSMKDTDGSKISGTNVDGEVLLDISEHTDYVVSAAVEITNTYTKVTGDDVHVYPDFKVYKTDDQRNPLAGATFQLAGANLSQNLVLTADANGMITFAGLKPGTYTLTELSAPADYAKDDSVYQVTIAQDGDPVERLVNGKHVKYYYYGVSVTKNNVNVTLSNNTLTVLNHKVSGELVITKDFGANNAYTPKDIFVKVSGPNNFFGEYTLNATNDWTVKLTGLELGNYVVQEKDASIPGYTLTTTMQDTDGNVTYGNASDGRVALAVGDLEAGFTAAVVTAQVDITNTYTKNTVNIAKVLPDLTVYKMRSGTTDVMLKDAEFELTYPDGSKKTFKSNADGKIDIADLEPGKYTLVETKAPEGYAIIVNTYIFEVVEVSNTGEVLQADGTWLNTYTYDIKEITDTNDTVDVRFVDDTNTLAVFNDKSTGSLTIKKEFGVWTTDAEGNRVNSSDITAETFAGYDAKILVTVAGPEGFTTQVIELNAANDWTVVLNNIPVGEYTVTEDQEAAKIDGHNLYVATNPNMVDGKVPVTLTKDNENRYATFNNTYSTHIPASLDVKKVDKDKDDQTKVLAGAVFGIYSDAECTKLIATRTTRQDGIATFPGFTTVGKTYYLKEISAPANYDKVDTVWKIEVSRDEGSEITKLTVNDTENAVWTQTGENSGVLTLTVANTRSLGDLVISKTVSYGTLTAAQIEELPEEYKPTSYTFKVTILDDNNKAWNDYNAKDVSVEVGKDFVIEDIPYGYTYSVQEVTTGKVFTSVVSNGSGIIGASNKVSATNTYTIDTETPGLNLLKHEVGAAKVIAGAKFELYSDAACANKIAEATSDADGRLNLPLTSVGTFYLKEVAPAAGYHPNDTVYTITTKYVYENDTVNKTIKQSIVVDKEAFAADNKEQTTMVLTNPDANPSDYEFHVINTPIKPVIISAEKVWNDDDYYARPDSVTVKLYKDYKYDAGEDWVLYDGSDATIELSASNNWRYVWNGGIEAGLTDAYNWKVVEVVSEDMTNARYELSSTTVENGHWVFTNTRNPNLIELTVEKKWIDNNDISYKPTSIEVQLFRDGEAYGKPVELNEANGWKHAWTGDTNINDAHKWTVKELVPDGYSADYTTSVDGQEYLIGDGTLTITNTRIIRDITVTVDKEWIHGSNPEANQPKEIEVQLIRKDGAEELVAATAVLNAENKWSYTWSEYTENGTVKKLTDFYEWDVLEVTVADYKETAHTKTEDSDANVTVAITNTFDKAKVVVTKTVEMEYFDENGVRKTLTECPDYGSYCPKHGDCVQQEEGREYAFVLSYTLNGKTETVEFTLKKDESKELYIPVGAKYSVIEVTDADTFWNPEYSANSVGQIDKYDQVTEIAVNNLYVFHDTSLTNVYEELEDGLFIATKNDSKTYKALNGAKFGLYSDKDCKNLLAEAETGADGKFAFHFKAEGTYYLKELEAPEHYKLSDMVYEIEVTASYETYKDSKTNEIIIVKILRANTDDLIGAAEANTTTYMIPNEEYGKINVSVSKVWLNPTGYTKQPTSVAVVLYRDGVAYETVTLSKDNNWSYKWTDLYEHYTWTVDEPNVPTNYSKKVTHIGNAWIITNAHKDIPLTGDDSNILLWAGATGVAVVGLGASLALLLKKRKEEDEQA